MTDEPPSGTIRRGCPHCPVYLDEPPPEYRTEFDAMAGEMRFRATWRSAVPALALHVVTEHPDTHEGRELLRLAIEHRARVVPS